MQRSSLSFCLGLAALILPLTARADITTIRNSDSVIDFAAGANQLRYGENVNGVTFDTEKGWQPDFNLGAGYLVSNPNPWLNNTYLRGDANIAIGNTAYTGAIQEISQNGILIIPAKSTTHDQIYNFSGKVGHSFPLGNYVMATPFVDIGYHYWNRELTGVGGYTEEYGNGTAMAGGMVQFSPLPSWVFTLTGEAGTTFAPTLHAFGTSYELQTRTIYEVDARIGYEFAPRFEVFGTGAFTGFDYGASPILEGSNEPESATHDFRALLGIAYHFQQAKPTPAHTTAPTYSYNSGASRGVSSTSARGF